MNNLIVETDYSIDYLYELYPVFGEIQTAKTKVIT